MSSWAPRSVSIRTNQLPQLLARPDSRSAGPPYEKGTGRLGAGFPLPGDRRGAALVDDRREPPVTTAVSRGALGCARVRRPLDFGPAIRACRSLQVGCGPLRHRRPAAIPQGNLLHLARLHPRPPDPPRHAERRSLPPASGHRHGTLAGALRGHLLAAAAAPGLAVGLAPKAADPLRDVAAVSRDAGPGRGALRPRPHRRSRLLHQGRPPP